MLWILSLTVFGLFYGSSTGLENKFLCLNWSLDLTPVISPPITKKSLFFYPNSGGSKKTVIYNGKIMDSRIKVYGQKVYIKSVTKEDDGRFSPSANGQNALVVKTYDCVEKTLKYMDMYEHKVPYDVQFLIFKPLDSQDEAITLWSRTNLQSNDERRGNIRENVWRISNLTQADSGQYYFMQKDDTVVEVVILSVKEPSAVGKYIGIAVGAVLLVTCSCCCCCLIKKCKTDNSKPQTVAAPTTHDTTSPGTAAVTAVTYHFQDVNPPTGPSYPAPAHPSVVPHQPPYQPASVYPPPQPGANMNPF